MLENGAAQPLRAARIATRNPVGEGHELIVVAARIAAAALLTAVAAGMILHLVAAGWARNQEPMTFAGLRDRNASEWLSLFAWNLRHLITPLAAAGLVLWRDPTLPRWARMLFGVFEALVSLAICVEIASNIANIAIALGGYSTRTALWLAPHGPLELSAYALALGVWAQALRRKLGAGLAVRAGVLSVMLLALAAAVEVAFR